jgi:ABC-2 type transport system ATP-binding protein
MIAASEQDVFIESPVADNASGATTTAIAATVFIPEHADGATYPLILHSHGWGGDRVTEADTQAPFDSSKFYSVAIDAEVKRFW